MEIEKQVKLCKICGQLKTRVLSGKYNSKDKTWKDEKGEGHWNGHVCPDCHRGRCK